MAGTAISPVATAIHAIEKRMEDFRQRLPAHIPAEKFVLTLKSAIGNNQKLAGVPLDLLLIEVQKAAADGLICDGREAAITIFRTKRNGQFIDAPKYIPMYQGLIKRVRNSGELVSMAAYLVYANEVTTINPETGEKWFRRWIDDDGEHVLYTPMMLGDRGEVAGGFSQVRLKDRTVVYCWMPVSELNKIKNRTKSRNQSGDVVGPWADDTEEMFKKTIIRRHCKTLPMDSDLANVFSRDDDMYEADANAPGVSISRPKANRAAALLANDREEHEVAEYEEVDHDPAEELPAEQVEREPAKRQPAAGKRQAEPQQRPQEADEYNGEPDEDPF
jgi:phage RecT family recombinase